MSRARHAMEPEGDRFAQVTFASFAAGAQGSSGGWRVGPTLGANSEQATWVAACAPTQLHPTTGVDDFLSQEDIDGLPRRFEYVPPALGPDGNAVYLQSVPAGSDATGRPGNVFTHAFIDTDPADTPPVPYPTDAYRGATFLTPFRKTAVNHVELVAAEPAVPADEHSLREGAFAVAWLVASQLLGDRTGALWALQEAVENPDTLAVLLVRNNLDAGYWLRALAATTTPSMAYATWRLSTFERARTMDAARMLAAGFRVVCVPAADRADLADVPHAAKLSIIDPSDPSTFRPATSGWSQLSQLVLPTAGADISSQVERLVEHLIAISDAAWPLLEGVTVPAVGHGTRLDAYGQALALAVIAFEREYSPEAVRMARMILDGDSSPQAASAVHRAATTAASKAAAVMPGAHPVTADAMTANAMTANARTTDAMTAAGVTAWLELLAGPADHLLSVVGGPDYPLLRAGLDARELSRDERSALIARLAEYIDAADTRGDIRGAARSRLVHAVLLLAADSSLINDEAVELGLTRGVESSLAQSAAFAAHLGSHDAQSAPAALGRVVRSAFIRRNTTRAGVPHPDWATRAGTTTTPAARTAYGFTLEEFTRAENTAGCVLSGRAAARADIQDLLRHLQAAEIAAIDVGSRPPGTHSNDSVTDIVALLKSRGHGADVAASRVEDIRHQRRIIAQIHPDADLVDIISYLRSRAGREVAELPRVIHSDVARSRTFQAATLRLWMVLVPFARAYPLLSRRVDADAVAALAESIVFDTNSGSDFAQHIYERYLRADLMDATVDEEVLSAAGGWLSYQIAGTALNNGGHTHALLGRVVRRIGRIMIADALLPVAFREGMEGA